MNTRIFYTTDIHGSERCFRKFLNAGKFYKADVIILGGDMTGKMMVPVVEYERGRFRARFLNKELVASNGNELEKLEDEIRYSGYYPHRTDSPGLEKLNANPEQVETLFSQLMLDTTRRWVRMAEDRLKGTSIKCFMTPGNDDQLVIDSAFGDSDRVVNPEGKIARVDDTHEMISSGYATITPWKCPRDVTEEELSAKIESMVSKVESIENCIFNLHCPPYDSGLDSGPKLDENLRYVTEVGQPVIIPLGSKAVRHMIEKYQPLVGLHGHIHESRGARKIGRTMCFNPGSEYAEGVLRGLVIDLDEKRLKSHLFTMG
jgi:Icc-related predicted phosphoesterase